MRKRINILYVHSSDEMYGADLILLQLVAGLNTQKFNPIVVLPTDVAYKGLLTQALSKRGVKVYHINLAVLRRKYLSFWGSLVYGSRLVRSTFLLIYLIFKEQIEIVHSNTSAVIPGALAARLTNRLHVWHIHEIIMKPRWLWRFTSWLLPRLSHCVVTVSDQTRQHLCKGNNLNWRKSKVIYNGIDASRFATLAVQDKHRKVRKEWGIKPHHVLIGMIGRVSHWKGQKYFLRVAEILAKDYPHARFALVGGTFPGQEHLIDELRDIVRSMALDERVILSDFRDDIPYVLNAYDIFVLPSTQPDPFPTVVLEAMAAGKPVIANAHGGSLEMIEHGVTGYLVKPGEPRAMASAIENLLNDSSERHRMGLNGQKRLEEMFSLQTFISKWESLYTDLSSVTRYSRKL